MPHVFGPVPSRRLGRSLGVDVVPYKTCSYDCLYCQIGRTTARTVERAEWVQLDEVVGEVEAKRDAKPDVITISGSGEPTLYSRIGELIARIKAITATPVAVLTNGSLLWMPEVRRDLAEADIVIPSLDAGDAATFGVVNRPQEGVSFEKMVDGLVEFRRDYRGKYWLEVLLLAGFTDTDDAVRKIAACARRIGPDKVQLNTVTRPPAESAARPVPPERMEALARLFDPAAEVIADFRGAHKEQAVTATRDEILDMLRRRPCSLDDVASGLGIHRNEAVKHLDDLASRGEITSTRVGDVVYYQPSQSS